jgi:hypothetical protein
MKPEAGDLTGDCFHPQITLHSKIAEYIAKTYFPK